MLRARSVGTEARMTATRNPSAAKHLFQTKRNVVLTCIGGEHQVAAPLASFLAEVVDEPILLGVENVLAEVIGFGDLYALHFAVFVPHECLSGPKPNGWSG